MWTNSATLFFRPFCPRNMSPGNLVGNAARVLIGFIGIEWERFMFCLVLQLVDLD